jgi:hypothetical protein
MHAAAIGQSDVPCRCYGILGYGSGVDLMTDAQREAVARVLALGVPAEWTWAYFAEEFPVGAANALRKADEVIAALEAAAAAAKEDDSDR